jgi:hypothetical protein
LPHHLQTSGVGWLVAVVVLVALSIVVFGGGLRGPAVAITAADDAVVGWLRGLDAPGLVGAERALAALRVASASGSEIFAVHVVADAELNPPERTFLAADPEQLDFQRALSPETRAAYDAAFASWRARVAAELHAMNATYVLTPTTEPVRDAVRRVVAGHAALASRTTS